jgi:ATP-binding cassette subfamily C protein LapB
MVDLPFFILLLGLLYYMGGAVVVAPVLGITVIAVANMVTYAKARHVNAASADLAYKRANQLIETLGAIETVKMTTSENQLLTKWEQRTDSGAYLGYLARQQSGFASHLTIITVQVTIVLTLIIGVYELRAGGITMGALAASSLLVGRAMAPMGNLMALFVRGFHILRSSSAIEQLLGARQEAAGDRQKSSLTRFKGRIAFNTVSFSYEAGSASILDNISFSIEPGERVGLIGRIGCGKSSLLKLLPRLREASSGSLLLDGHDIRQFDPSFLRHNIALMPQDIVLIEGSLRDNICFGLGDVNERDFEQAVELSGVRDFASIHPQGYGMQVGPRGERLSGGERAGVVLARTLLRQPKMVLLDEPTAAMDNELERRIVNNLGSWLEGRTLILATHRAPVLALVDRIIWMHNGRVVADGPRDDVLAKLRG